MTSTYSASMVVALVNTQRRAKARDRARDVMAWEGVVAQLGGDSEEYGNATARLDEARTRFDNDVRWAFQHYAYLLRTSSGLTVQYRPVPDGKTSLNGADVWTELVSASRAVAIDSLAAAYVGQLITTGNFGRDLTPKEVFSLPFSNPNWPLVARIVDLRRAVFELATGPEWMLVDSDGTEIRPERADQIQVSTMQQVLQPRVQLPGRLPHQPLRRPVCRVSRRQPLTKVDPRRSCPSPVPLAGRQQPRQLPPTRSRRSSCRCRPSPT